MTTTPTTVTDEVANIVRQTLEEKFGDLLVFDPIEVIPKIDLDGDEYLHIYMVYDGDRDLLDTAWLLGFYGLIQPKLVELGVEGIPSKSFVEKSDWEEVYGKGNRGKEVFEEWLTLTLK